MEVPQERELEEASERMWEAALGMNSQDYMTDLTLTFHQLLLKDHVTSKMTRPGDIVKNQPPISFKNKRQFVEKLWHMVRC
jgi:hypothetical protein